MKIFVDKLPSKPEFCPFSIKAQLYVNNSIYAPNCKLMIDTASGWETMTFSATQNRYNCPFYFGKQCLFLTPLNIGDK